jgi:hypothetical protein
MHSLALFGLAMRMGGALHNGYSRGHPLATFIFGEEVVGYLVVELEANLSLRQYHVHAVAALACYVLVCHVRYDPVFAHAGERCLNIEEC